MTLRQAAQQALEALVLWEDEAPHAWSQADEDAVAALRAALAEPEQEPVAWELRMGKTDRVLMEITNNPQRAQDWRASLCEVVPLYYAPTPRRPLTMEQLHGIREHQRLLEKLGPVWAPMLYYFCQAIERMHGIGEQHE